MDMLIGVIGVGSIAILFLLVIAGIASYVLSSLGLMKMAQREGVEEAWLAWVPVGNMYIIGKLIKTLEFRGEVYPQPELIFPGILLATMVLGRIPFLGSVIKVISAIVFFYALFLLYKRYAPEQATIYMVISILLPPLGSAILIYKLRNATPILE